MTEKSKRKKRTKPKLVKDNKVLKLPVKRKWLFNTLQRHGISNEIIVISFDKQSGFIHHSRTAMRDSRAIYLLEQLKTAIILGIDE